MTSDPDPRDAPPTFADDFDVYPASFPVADRQPYGYVVDMGVIRSDFSAGNARQRRAFRTMPTALALSFHLRVEELFFWQNWVNANAFDWFHCPVSTMYAGGPPEAKNLRHEVLRFTSDLSVQMDGWDWLSVTVAAELSGDAFAALPPWGAGGWIIGGTPGDPSVDWVSGGTPGDPSTDWVVAGTPPFPAILV